MAVKNNSNMRNNESYFDFGALYNKYKRYWWLFAAMFVASMACAVFYLYVKRPVYQITASILVAQEDSGSGIGSAIVKSLPLGNMSSKVDDEVLVVSALSISKEMVRDLKLNRTYKLHKGFMKNVDVYGCTPITVDAPDAVFDTLNYAMNFRVKVDKAGKIKVKVKEGWFNTLAELEADRFPVTVKTKYGIYVLNKTKDFVNGEDVDLKVAVAGFQATAEGFNEEVGVSIASKKSNGIVLVYKDAVIQRGKDVLDKIVELYNKRCQTEKDAMAVNTGKFIDERLNIIYNDLSASEADIEKYKTDNNLVDMTTDVTNMYGRRNVSESARTQLTTQLEIMKMVRDFVNDPRNEKTMIPFGVGQTSDAGGPVDMYNALVLERTKLASSAKANNISLKAMDDQIALMRENVRKAVDKAIDGLEIQITRTAAVENKAQSKLGMIPAKEREFRQLYRQQAIKNELYTFLLQKREENALVLAATTPKGKIVDQAYAYSEPVAPKKGVVLFMGFLLGILMPIVILYIKAMFTTKFSSQDELESISTVPVIGEICHNRHRSSLVVREGKTSSIVELFRLLRNNVQFMLPNEDKNVILVTSSISGEGKTFVGLNLASSFALLGKRVALVGLDIRSPKLAEYLSMKSTPGVTSYLAKKDITLADIVQHSTEVQNLDVYVGGPIPPNPSELLLSSRTKQLIEDLRNEYDCVILDTAPIAMVSDSFSLSPYADLVVYVTRANYTKRSLVKYFNSVVSRGQIKNAGVIINDSNPKRSQGYGYGYGAKED